MFQTLLTHKFEIYKIENCGLFEFCFLNLNSEH